MVDRRQKTKSDLGKGDPCKYWSGWLDSNLRPFACEVFVGQLSADIPEECRESVDNEYVSAMLGIDVF